jgi:tetratricopeptide (TPR) repeat protein
LWRLRREQGDPVTAASGFDRFLAENPEQRMDGLALRANLLVRAGEGEKAVALAEAALRAFPGHVGLSQVRASALDQAGRHRESLQWYAARSGARPWDPEALNNHAYQLALAGEKLALALRMSTRAVAERPVAAYLDTLGWVHFRRGQLPLAREWLERALALGPEPEISGHLGEVLWVQGEREAALKVWREGLAGAAPEDIAMLQATARRVAGQDL